ncbi:hypothetical protein L1987_34857 [Smallanthus sonchifolius]|uniref:Uncharacterized protein n=1 Tax=Smallanthus sonchifolius TaxID=185202 RepID=A0ACB9HVT7_9ASTR|nr:hypothetical protein L1987_34857 [Smallanthus sonchifolius]
MGLGGRCVIGEEIIRGIQNQGSDTIIDFMVNDLRLMGLGVKVGGGLLAGNIIGEEIIREGPEGVKGMEHRPLLGVNGGRDFWAWEFSLHKASRWDAFVDYWEDFKPILRELLATHPGLEFLQSTPEFQERYAETVIYRIFYYVNRAGNGRLTLRELKRGNLIAAMLHADEEEDINKVLRIVDRIFSQVPRKFTSKVEGKMGYEDVVYFILSEEDKSSEPSLEYWFKCIDLDGNGVLTKNEMQFFYEEQLHRMECMAQEPERENPTLTEWDRFAHREYVRLSMEEDAEDASNGSADSSSMIKAERINLQKINLLLSTAKKLYLPAVKSGYQFPSCVRSSRSDSQAGEVTSYTEKVFTRVGKVEENGFCGLILLGSSSYGSARKALVGINWLQHLQRQLASDQSLY